MRHQISGDLLAPVLVVLVGLINISFLEFLELWSRFRRGTAFHRALMNSPRKLVRLLAATRSLPLALHAWRREIPWLHLERQGDDVFLKGTSISVKDLPSPLSDGLSLHLGRLAPFGFSLQVVDDRRGNKTILLDTGEVKLWLDDGDVTCIAEEVFGTQEYGIRIAKEAIVIDIGMNVATTALYFAKLPEVQRIVAFEPSPSAIKKAERNFAINPEIARKVEVRRYGLGEANGTAYLHVAPGLSAISRVSRGANSETAGSDHVLVEIRDAETELQSVLAETADHQQVILKVDCEGSEKEIFARLSANTLSRIDAVLLEWHSQEIAREIGEMLEKLAFSLLVRRSQKDIGMLYAFRRQS
jgi:FkbM family methyltransferase